MKKNDCHFYFDKGHYNGVECAILKYEPFKFLFKEGVIVRKNGIEAIAATILILKSLKEESTDEFMLFYKPFEDEDMMFCALYFKDGRWSISTDVFNGMISDAVEKKGNITEEAWKEIEELTDCITITN